MATALPGLIVSGASLLDSVFGGATQAQKDAARVARGNQLFTCAVSGDPIAARVILYGAQNTGSDSQIGVQHYQALWAQLVAQYPNIANAASAAGKVADTGSGKGCPGGIAASGTTSPVVTGLPATVAGAAPIQQAGLLGSIPTLGWVAIGAAALFALSGSGSSRRRRR